jgi:hypothetical protein
MQSGSRLTTEADKLLPVVVKLHEILSASCVHYKWFSCVRFPGRKPSLLMASMQLRKDSDVSAEIGD